MTKTILYGMISNVFNLLILVAVQQIFAIRIRLSNTTFLTLWSIRLIIGSEFGFWFILKFTFRDTLFDYLPLIVFVSTLIVFGVSLEVLI